MPAPIMQTVEWLRCGGGIEEEDELSKNKKIRRKIICIGDDDDDIDSEANLFLRLPPKSIQNTDLNNYYQNDFQSVSQNCGVSRSNI